MPDPTQSLAPGAEAHPPVAPGAAGNPAAASAAGPAAGDTAPEYGGLRAGRAREDGLTPGSPEALEADRKKDRLRKRESRKTKKPDPAALPGAAAADGAPAAAPGAVAPVPGVDGAAPIPWDPESLQEVFAIAVPTAEELMVGQAIGEANKAKLTASLIKEIEDGVKFTPREKQALEKFGPRATAKLLNRLHVPAGTQDELIVVAVVAKIGLRHAKLMTRLKQLTAAANAGAQPAKPAEKKEGAAPT